MNLRPLQDRILIKPEIPPNITESGLILQEERKPEQTGTVVAVGPCSHPMKDIAEDLAHRLAVWAHGVSIGDDAQNLLIAAQECLKDVVRKEPEVKVGDYVVFSWTSGQEIWVEDGQERYLLMREADILCVVEGVEV